LLPIVNEMISKLLATVALIGMFVASLTITPIHTSESTQPFKVTDEIKDHINALVDAKEQTPQLSLELLIRTELSSIALVNCLKQTILM
jgi:hypothetical protein